MFGIHPFEMFGGRFATGRPGKKGDVVDIFGHTPPWYKGLNGTEWEILIHSPRDYRRARQSAVGKDESLKKTLYKVL